MRKDIKEIVELSERICAGLDKLSEQEKIFNTDIGIFLENCSWEMLRMKNNINNIGELV